MRANNVFFEDAGMRLMERFLDMSVQRQSLISGNLANVDTPGYKTVDLDFEHELGAAVAHSPESLTMTHQGHMSGNKTGHRSGQTAEVEGLTLRNDLNNVNIDREMGQLSTNALKFSMVAQILGGKLRQLKATIAEGT